MSVRNADHLGQFIFPNGVLFKRGFVSKDEKGGKRAMRVYPPWHITDNRQAKETQAWQLEYFIIIQPTIDSARVKQLFI